VISRYNDGQSNQNEENALAQILSSRCFRNEDAALGERVEKTLRQNEIAGDCGDTPLHVATGRNCVGIQTTLVTATETEPTDL
jgi:hypothetical protein